MKNTYNVQPFQNVLHTRRDEYTAVESFSDKILLHVKLFSTGNPLTSN